jgi:hypothetical protein
MVFRKLPLAWLNYSLFSLIFKRMPPTFEQHWNTLKYIEANRIAPLAPIGASMPQHGNMIANALAQANHRDNENRGFVFETMCNLTAETAGMTHYGDL